MEKAGKVGAIALITSILALVLTFTNIAKNVRDLVSGEEPKRTPAALQIVDLTIGAQTEKRAFLDIKLRNTGEEVAFVKRVVVTITSHSLIAASGGVEASGTYELEFPANPDRFPFTLDSSVSQKVDPTGASSIDRFVVNMATKSDGLIHRYNFKVGLLYNENQRVDWPGELTVLLR